MTRFSAPEVYVTKELAESLLLLPASHKFHRWIADMKIVLKEHKFAGELIKKGQIPSYYSEKFGVNNLYRYDHPEGYRSCYTVVSGCP